METPPSSSFAQSTSLFSGASKEDVYRSILLQAPASDHNSLTNSSDRTVAISATGPLKDFKFDDFRQAYAMMNGPAKYPFQNIVQIENYKFDPWYFDGSENQPNINVNENLIGTPLGTSVLEDPRMTYVKNIMVLKENEGQANQLNDAYIKELYMLNSEKGSNYYTNMLERQQEGLDYWSREGRKRKNSSIPGIAFTYNLPQGETQRTKKNIRVAQTVYSATPNVQRNFRQDQMNRLPADPTDTVSFLGSRFSTISSRGSGDPSVSSENLADSDSTGSASKYGSLGAASVISFPNSVSSEEGELISLGSNVTPAPRTPFTPLPRTRGGRVDVVALYDSLHQDGRSISSGDSASSQSAFSFLSMSQPVIPHIDQTPEIFNIQPYHPPRRNYAVEAGEKWAKIKAIKERRAKIGFDELDYNAGNISTFSPASSVNSAANYLDVTSSGWQMLQSGKKLGTDTPIAPNKRSSGLTTEFGTPFAADTEGSISSLESKSSSSGRSSVRSRHSDINDDSTLSSYASVGSYNAGVALGKYKKIKEAAKLSHEQKKMMKMVEGNFKTHPKWVVSQIDKKSSLYRPAKTLERIWKRADLADSTGEARENFANYLESI